MKISQEADYALRIIMMLAENGQNVKIDAKTIADKQSIPIRFALKIMRKLGMAGIIKSFRGVYGGYRLNRPMEEITFKDVIEAIDGQISINRCVIDEGFCNMGRMDTCPLHKQFMMLQKEISETLEKVTFEDIINDMPELEESELVGEA